MALLPLSVYLASNRPEEAVALAPRTVAVLVVVPLPLKSTSLALAWLFQRLPVTYTLVPLTATPPLKS